jgi:CubicO group peptidase (beta-lactamase class C family)
MPPGVKFDYSGGGTTITQLLVTSITGRDYTSYMKDEVLLPLGMLNSSYQQPPGDTNSLATGYYHDGKQVDGKYHIYPEQAAAGLWTTPSDLSKYVIECQLAYEGKSSKVLNKEMMQKRLSFYIDSSVGLGVFLQTRGGLKYFNHNGGNEAFLSTYLGSFKDGNGVVVMINGEDFSVINEVVNSVGTVYGWKDFYTPNKKKLINLPKDSMSQFIGDYLLDKDTISVVSCEGGLCLEQNHSKSIKIYFSEPTKFSALEVSNADFFAIRDASGKIEALELIQNGRITRLPRIKNPANKAPGK